MQSTAANAHAAPMQCTRALTAPMQPRARARTQPVGIPNTVSKFSPSRPVVPHVG